MNWERTKLYRWLNERLPLTQVKETASHKVVPMHRYSALYFFGGMTL